MNRARTRAVRAFLLSSAFTALTAGTALAAVETVVVTAERRSEDIQRVPVTLTAVGQKQLDQQHILTTTDLVRAVPSLTTSDEGVFQIRSIGTQGFGRSAEQSVSVVLDGVVLGRTLTNQMYDLDHVEVLSGPQGTLFGKNASSGVINIVTRQPVMGQFEETAHVEAGDHDYVHSWAAVNLPVGDDLAIRISLHHDTTGHIVYNTIYNKWDYNADTGVRVRALWEPISNLHITFGGDYQKLRSNGVNGVADFAGGQVYTFAPTIVQPPPPAPPVPDLKNTLAGCGIVASPSNNKVCANSLYAPGVDIGNTYGRWNGGLSMQIDYDMGGYTLTSISALRESINEDFDVHADIAGEFGDTLPQNILDRNLVPYFARTWSEEARIASPTSDPVNFVAGVYYSKTYTHDQIDQSGQLGVPLGPFEFRRFIDMFIDQQNYAGFGQVNWQIDSHWKVFLGARVTHDDNSDFSFNSFPDMFPAGPFFYTGDTGFFSVYPVNSCTISGGQPYAGAPPVPCPAGTSTTTPGTLRTTEWSGKAGVQYQLDDDTMFFTSIARGYKGPFMNESASWPLLLPNDLLIKSEFPTDIELGMKTTVFDRLALNVSLFTDKIRNFQTTIYVPPGPGHIVANFLQGNAPYAISRGIEATFFGNLTDDISINGGFIYNDAHFNKGFLVNCGAGPCPALPQLPFAPRWKTNLAGDLHHQIAPGYMGFLQADFSWSDAYHYGSAPGYPASPPRYYVNLRSGLRFDDDKWQVSLFCRNCLNKHYPINAGFDGFSGIDGGIGAGGEVATIQFLTIDSVRVWGISVDFQN